ncbi:MAG TPA: hypothetical protein VED43_01990 [Mycobacterium sp.]|nr:hypothetical protein [Mycobacterium sp.]
MPVRVAVTRGDPTPLTRRSARRPVVPTREELVAREEHTIVMR